ncbi:brain protein I3 [Ornithorhynchus anatinus]|nr:brain protein I3 [Ornithorhynchus anatinus]
MDSKPLLQDRPPPYTVEAGRGDYAYGQQHQQHNYGAIPAEPPQPNFQPGFQPAFQPPPYPYTTPVGPNYPHGAYTVIQQPASSIVVVGGCPACRVGVLEDAFTCFGIFCAIFFFPFGIFFCLALRQRRCPNCGATFG